MSPRHPELDSGSINVGLSRKGRTLREEWIDSGSESGMTQNCHAELVSASSRRDDEGSPLTPTLSRRARGKHAAFTLAEVLITLAIIGIVAAMTIPTLINNYNKRIVEVRLQKAYAELYQAFKLAEVNHGNPATWNYTSNNDDIDNFLETYLLPNLRYQKYCDETNLEDCFSYPVDSASGIYGYVTSYIGFQRALTLNNGTAVFFQGGFGFEPSPPHIHMVIDVNGPKQGANLLGKDIFSMILIIRNRITQYEEGMFTGKRDIQGFHAYGKQFSPAFTRNEMLELCKSENPRMCSALIQNDGWKISDDYPWYK